MKRSIFSIIFLCLISQVSHAQAHVIKTNLLGLAYKSINLGYEFKIESNVSVGLNSEYRVPGSVNLYILSDRIGTDEISYSGDIQLDGIGVTPYFRYYTRQALNGIYLQPFFRYLNYSFELPYEYDIDNELKNGATNGNLKGIGGGITSGIQLQLWDHIVIDCYFGFGLISGNVSAFASYPGLEESDYKFAKDAIDDLKEEGSDIIFWGKLLEKIEAGSDATSAWVDIENGLFPSIKVGILIGYSF